MSTSIRTSKGIEFTDVPPLTTPTLKVVLGFGGTATRENFAIAPAIAYAGFTRPNAP